MTALVIAEHDNATLRPATLNAVTAAAAAETAVRHAIAYAKEREAFGETLLSFQNTRFVLAECAADALAARTLVGQPGGGDHGLVGAVEGTAHHEGAGDEQAADVAMTQLAGAAGAHAGEHATHRVQRPQVAQGPSRQAAKASARPACSAKRRRRS